VRSSRLTHLLAVMRCSLFTRKWDHVAMVVRWWNNELRLLEGASSPFTRCPFFLFLPTVPRSSHSCWV
jgi:hypothetical protein